MGLFGPYYWTTEYKWWGEIKTKRAATKIVNGIRLTTDYEVMKIMKIKFFGIEIRKSSKEPKPKRFIKIKLDDKRVWQFDLEILKAEIDKHGGNALIIDLKPHISWASNYQTIEEDLKNG